MNKTLAITTIALVAVIMGFSAVAPMMPQAFAAHGEDHPGNCEDGFEIAAEKKIGNTGKLIPVTPCP